MTNDTLCDWAAAAVGFYDSRAEGHRILTDEGACPMLLASVMHLADREGWDFDAMLAQGRATYRAEIAAVEGEAAQ